MIPYVDYILPLNAHVFQAQDSGAFKEEMAPVTVKKKNKEVVFDVSLLLFFFFFLKQNCLSSTAAADEKAVALCEQEGLFNAT